VSALPAVLYEPLIDAALHEDLGRAGDLTTGAVVPGDAVTTAHLVARAAGTIAGLPVAARTFTRLDPRVEVDLRVDDGDAVSAGTVLAVVSGPARAILTAERVALNFLGHLSGVATTTAAVVAAVAGHGTAVAGTRKTTPGLRALEKYAIRMGGGSNHRFGLDDAVMVKDNHIAVAGGVGPAVTAARDAVGHLVKIEVEVGRLEQIQPALDAGAEVLLLDNMGPDLLAEAVTLVARRAVTEASGGITLDNAAEIAASGVDVISLGWLTHSAPNLDVALDVVG
jgi:nicotinate-nucleotide pyrophosphorylase (carboxylating)